MLLIRALEWSTALERDYRREYKTYGKALDEFLSNVLADLLIDEPLSPNRRDHNLIGRWAGARECHVRPDLLLVYEKYQDEEEKVLFLIRLGAHSELF